MICCTGGTSWIQTLAEDEEANKGAERNMTLMHDHNVVMDVVSLVSLEGRDEVLVRVEWIIIMRTWMTSPVRIST